MTVSEDNVAAAIASLNQRLKTLGGEIHELAEMVSRLNESLSKGAETDDADVRGTSKSD